MENLFKVCSFLDEYFSIRDIADDSCNGLQVSGKKEVERVVCMLDGSQEGFEKAVEEHADMIIVHHGLFWGNIKSLTGVTFERVKDLIHNDISLYAVHLPLDLHHETGNNVAIIKALGLTPKVKFGDYHGIEIGYITETKTDITRFCENVRKNINPEIRTALFGPESVRRVAVVSGGGADLIFDAKRCGADTFLTGESKLHVYHLAQELGINLIYAGHYATEVLGIKMLADFLPKKLNIETKFINIPTIF